jgi:hypothetical protein
MSASGPSEALEGSATERRRRARAPGGGAPRAVSIDTAGIVRFISRAGWRDEASFVKRSFSKAQFCASSRCG